MKPIEIRKSTDLIRRTQLPLGPNLWGGSPERLIVVSSIIGDIGVRRVGKSGFLILLYDYSHLFFHTAGVCVCVRAYRPSRRYNPRHHTTTRTQRPEKIVIVLF